MQRKIFNQMNQKGFINITIIILVVTIFGTIGYFALVKKQALPIETTQPQQINSPTTPQIQPITNNSNPSSTAPKTVSQNDIDDCGLIANSFFRSINQYEGGLGPNGPMMGYWGIQFQKGTALSDYDKPTFQWHHSDVSESGTYTCQDNVLQVKFFDHSITAYYDGSKKILTWNGVAYKKVE